MVFHCKQHPPSPFSVGPTSHSAANKRQRTDAPLRPIAVAAMVFALTTTAGCELPNTVCTSDDLCSADYRCVHLDDGQAGLCKRTDEIPPDIIRILDGENFGRLGEECAPDTGACDDGLICDDTNTCQEDGGEPEPEPAPEPAAEPDPPLDPSIVTFTLDDAWLVDGEPIPVVIGTMVTVMWATENVESCVLSHDGTDTTVAAASAGTQLSITASGSIELDCTDGQAFVGEEIDGIVAQEGLGIGPISVTPDAVYSGDFVTVSSTIVGFRDGDVCALFVTDATGESEIVFDVPDDGRAEATVLFAHGNAIPTDFDVKVQCTAAGESPIERAIVVSVAPASSFDVGVEHQVLELDDGTAFLLEIPITHSGVTSCTFGNATTPAQTIEVTPTTTTLAVVPEIGTHIYDLECFRGATSIEEVAVSVAAVTALIPAIPNVVDSRGFVVFGSDLTTPAAAPSEIVLTGAELGSTCSATGASGGLLNGVVDLDATAGLTFSEATLDGVLTCSFVGDASEVSLPFTFLRADIQISDEDNAPFAGDAFNFVVTASGMSSCVVHDDATASDEPFVIASPSVVTTTAAFFDDVAFSSVLSVDCVDVFGESQSVDVDVIGIQAEIIARDATRTNFDNGEFGVTSYDFTVVLDVPNLPTVDRQFVSCGNATNGFDPVPATITFNSIEVEAGPSTETRTFFCRYDGVVFDSIDIKMQIAYAEYTTGYVTDPIVVTSAPQFDADTNIIVGDASWFQSGTAPISNALMLITGDLFLVLPTLDGAADLLPNLEEIGGTLKGGANGAAQCAVKDALISRTGVVVHADFNDGC